MNTLKTILVFAVFGISLQSITAQIDEYVSVLAAPINGSVNFLNPNEAEARSVFENIPTAYVTNLSLTNLNIKVGYCYNYKDGRILGLDDNLDCYNYYVQEADGSAHDSYDITGYVTSVGNYYKNGYFMYAINGVTEVDDCGETEFCDKIIVSSVATKTVLKEMLETFSSQCKVRVRGKKVWNFEGIDIVIDKINCLDSQ